MTIFLHLKAAPLFQFRVPATTDANALMSLPSAFGMIPNDLTVVILQFPIWALAPLHSAFGHIETLLVLSICHSLAPVLFSLPEQILLCRHPFCPSAISAFSR